MVTSRGNSGEGRNVTPSLIPLKTVKTITLSK